LQTLERRKKKTTKPVTETVQNTKSFDTLSKNDKFKHVPKAKKPSRNQARGSNTKQFYEITTIKEDDESSNQTLNKLQAQNGYEAQKSNPIVHEQMGYAKRQNNRYKSLNSDLQRVSNNSPPQNQLVQKEYMRNSSQRRVEDPNNIMKPNVSTMSVPIKNNLKNFKQMGGAKSSLPKVGGRIPGYTTKDGTFKPYTYSVGWMLNFRSSKINLRTGIWS
jgi:hypothetical protein